MIMKLQNSWGEQTLMDLEKLTKLLGVLGCYLNLSIISPGCIAVHWLCLPGVVPKLEEAIIAAASSLHAEGVEQVFIGDRPVLEPSEGIILLFVCVCLCVCRCLMLCMYFRTAVGYLTPLLLCIGDTVNCPHWHLYILCHAQFT